MTSRTLLLTLFAATALAQAGCGGGGGGGDSAPAPAAAPLPPSIESSRLFVARVTAPCAATLNCLPFTSATLDESGELTVLWEQTGSGSSSELHAANYATGASTPLSTGLIDQGFVTATNAPQFTARALAPRRMLLLQRDTAPAGSPAPAPGVQDALHARVIDLQANGTPLAGSSTLLPTSLSPVGVLPSLVQDSSGALYGFVATTPLPASPVDLGRGQTMTLVAAPSYAFSTVTDASIVEFPASAAPRALWVVSGTQSASTAGRQVYLAETSLTTGQVLPPTQVSTHAYVSTSPQIGCFDTPDVRARAVSNSTMLVAWREINAAGDGCNLVVNGATVNTSGKNVSSYAVNGTDARLVAVWTEHDGTPGSNRTLWSTRLPTDTAWSAPVRLAPQYVGADIDALIRLQATGPGGTLAVLWEIATPVAGTNTSSVYQLLSKYAGGAWSTVSSRNSSTATSLTINGHGQAALLTGDNGDCGSTCQELAAYRF